MAFLLCIVTVDIIVGFVSSMQRLKRHKSINAVKGGLIPKKQQVFYPSLSYGY